MLGSTPKDRQLPWLTVVYWRWTPRIFWEFSGWMVANNHQTTTKQLPNNYQKNPALLLFPISRRCQFRFASVCQFRREIHWTCQDTLCVIGLKDFKGQNCVDMLLMHLQHELRGSQWQVWDCRGATAKQFAVLWPQHVGHGKVMEASLWGKSHWRPL